MLHSLHFSGTLPCKPDYFKWDFWCLFSLFFTLGGGCLCFDANSQLEQISASGKQISLIGIVKTLQQCFAKFLLPLFMWNLLKINPKLAECKMTYHES